jgi:mannosyltransferase OCH1-like enzyme
MLNMDVVKVPKNVMQTWKNKTVPKHWLSSQKAIMKHMVEHSGWSYTLMTDEDNRQFCQENFPDFLQYYDQLEYGIMRADAIRYMWLYKIGGVYMDLDIMIKRPIDELFTEDKDIYVVKSGNFSSFYTNAFMGSKPGVKLWLECIDEMAQPYRIWQVGKHLKVMATTGPLMLTRVIKSNKKVKKTFHELKAETITACTVCDPKPCDIGRNSFAVTLEGSSWIEADTKVYNKVYCNFSSFSAILILSIFIIVCIFWYIKERRRISRE